MWKFKKSVKQKPPQEESDENDYTYIHMFAFCIIGKWVIVIFINRGEIYKNKNPRGKSAKDMN